MIRPVVLADAAAIAAIYNEYVLNTTITFEIEPVSVEEMSSRIAGFSVEYPYLVYEEGGEVLGYAYAHRWKERAAYAQTLETTIYLRPDVRNRGLGSLLLDQLISECRNLNVHALIACITEGNKASIALHLRKGFQQVACFHQVGRKFDQWLGVSDYELVL